MFAESFVWLGFLQSISYINSIPTDEKSFAVGKKSGAQMPLFNLIFLGLGWPSVGEFVGFMIILMRFPTQSGPNVTFNLFFFLGRDGRRLGSSSVS